MSPTDELRRSVAHVGRRERSARRFWLLTLVALVAIAATSVLVTVRSGSSEGARVREPLAVESVDGARFGDLASLVTASDLVVEATVQSTERGRAFGDAGGASLVSRVVLLRVDAVLKGASGASLVVEEEGWLTDGTPLVVDGLAPTQVGDHGVWFLVRAGADGTHVLTSTQGRFVERDGRLQGGDRGDALVASLAAVDLATLRDRVRDAA